MLCEASASQPRLLTRITPEQLKLSLDDRPTDSAIIPFIEAGIEGVVYFCFVECVFWFFVLYFV